MTKQLDIFGKLFGSVNRVKLMKFFLLNPELGYATDDIAERLRVKPAAIVRELADLAAAGFIKSKSVVKITVGKRKTSRKRVKGFMANPEFVLRQPLYDLLIDSGSVHVADLPKQFGKAGRVLLLVVSGFFLHDRDRAMDLLIVGDRLNRKIIESEVKKIEADIGKELRWALFDREEFMYRLNMYDKLLRDIFDYPHTKIINKIDHPELRG